MSIVNLFCTGCRTGDVERKEAVDSGCGIDVQLVWQDLFFCSLCDSSVATLRLDLKVGS